MDSASTSDYIKAENTPKETKKLCLKAIKIVTKVLWMLICEIFLAIYRFANPPKSRNISGQLALITGGANGLGRSIAHKFAEQGCNIVIVDILDTENAVREIIEKYGVKCQGYRCDVSDSNAIRQLKHNIVSALGDVDILVNNAGIILSGLLLQTKVKDIERCFAVNLVAHLKTVKEFLPSMIERRRGAIVAIASITAKVSAPLTTTYSSTKYGVDGFMDALYDDLCVGDQDEFIKLTTVYPGFISTRKDLMDFLDEIDGALVRLKPDFVADRIIKSVLRGDRKVFIAPGIPHLLINLLPDRVIKYLKSAECNMKRYVKDKNTD